MSRIIVVDQHAIGILDKAVVEDSWFNNFCLPSNADGVRRIELNDVIYILSDQADIDSGLLVISAGPDGVFSGKSQPRWVFERIIRVGLRQFNRGITLPVQWQPFHDGSRLSVYAEPFAQQSRFRIHFDQAPRSSMHLYAYAITDAPQEISRVPIDFEAYDEAIAGYLDALVAEQPKATEAGHFGILFNETFGIQFAGAVSIQEWIDHRLNDDQIKFLDKKYDCPIRLRGAAGTGKTQSMAIKCLRDLYSDHDGGGDKSFAFITHSSALAHEIVRGMFYSLDPSAKWSSLRSHSGRPKLWVGTLYELAQDLLNYQKKGLTPLSLDGQDGREYQRILIGEAIVAVSQEPRIKFELLAAKNSIGERMVSPEARSLLVEDLMNEFACILDAENIRKGTTEAERYVKAARDAWQMHLPQPADREIAIEIHDIYRQRLRNERLLSMDQMVADFCRYLSTHEWAHLREEVGFDAIFVDEYHYFNRVEAMTFQPLFKLQAEHSGRWPLMMAYDLKQGTSDAAIGGGIDKFRNPGVGESLPVDLTLVYRSTQKITAFLKDLDGSFPALDLEGEYRLYRGKSQQELGHTPTLITFDDDAKLIDDVFDRAIEIGRTLPGKGTEVAVLCLNEGLFEKYRKAGRIQGKFVAITAREDLRELRYAKSRCVFSMPDYVAGLQFHTVFLIHADDVDYAEDAMSQGHCRRYVSRVYLGASRAMKNLVIVSSNKRGGPCSVLSGPRKNLSLI